MSKQLIKGEGVIQRYLDRRNFGFITGQKGETIFFHGKARSNGAYHPVPGDIVRYVASRGDDGLRASRVDFTGRTAGQSVADFEKGRIQGVVDRFDFGRGYGLVKANGADYFLHVSELIQGARTVKPGDQVSFAFEQTYKGLRALDVTVIKSGSDAVDAAAPQQSVGSVDSTAHAPCPACHQSVRQHTVFGEGLLKAEEKKFKVCTKCGHAYGHTLSYWIERMGAPAAYALSASCLTVIGLELVKGIA
jgi:cold shock CspA family protein